MASIERSVDIFAPRVRPSDRRPFFMRAGGLASVRRLLPPKKNGGPHFEYFRQLSVALRDAGIAHPTVIVDRTRLRQNIDTILSHVGGMNLRVAAKSIPSLPMIAEVCERLGTNRLKVFNQPFLTHVAEHMPDADVLLGKPLPVVSVARFYAQLPGSGFDPAVQVQWLVDTPRRLVQYRDLAREQRLKMQINVEVDAGMHRGGISTPDQLNELLDIINASDCLSFAGLMTYDVHLAHIPKVFGLQRRAIERSYSVYRTLVGAARARVGNVPLSLNTAGSQSYRLHDGRDGANEITIGSALTKPAIYDVATLVDHVPAAFVATPVLKVLDRTEIPVLEALAPYTALWDRNTQRAFFIFGGNWMAEPISPPGLQLNRTFGRSSNQELLNGSDLVELAPDDYVFFRPTQSEGILHQFGDIAVYENGKIVAFWSIFFPGG